jgi:hypothetical protein
VITAEPPNRLTAVFSFHVLTFVYHMLGFKRITYFCPNTTAQIVMRNSPTITGVMRTKTWFMGNLISDEVNHDATREMVSKARMKANAEAAARLERDRQRCAKSASEFEDVLLSILKDGTDGLVASISHTFDNGYTSVWNYKVQDGKLVVQKPWGNKARAYFSDVTEMVDDFRRYLGYGFELA